MDLIVSFVLFIACMAASLVAGFSMLVPLALGFVLFAALAVRRGFSVRQVLRLAAKSLRESFVVIGILLLIGCLTGMWRLSGTVAYFVTLGVSSIPPRMFLLAAFLLSAAMSFALGTSFGVTATAGVILMSIARAGGVSPILAAGAIFSGVYVGDRGSPAASSGNLVAVLTHTDMRDNVRKMFRCSLVPFLVCSAQYGVLSLWAPMERTDSAVLGLLGEEFRLHWLCLLPAVLMIVLPFCRVNIRVSMAVSLAASALVALTVQHAGIWTCLRVMALGFVPENAALGDMLSGGGVRSMLEVCAILVISCSYGSIFEGTKLLDGVSARIAALGAKLGRFPAMMVLAFGICAVFCNQTVGIIMQHNLSSVLYGKDEAEAQMLDIENSVITIAGIVPWCIASSLPLAMLGADARAVPLGFYLWLLPLWWLLRSCRKKKS